MNDPSTPNDNTEAEELPEVQAEVKYPPSRYVLYGRDLTDDETWDVFEKHLNAYKQEMKELNPERKPRTPI